MKGSISLAAVLLFTNVGFAAEQALVWPQFRGPNGSGIADEQKPPIDIGPEKNVKWKVDVPSGLSSPIVAGDKLILTAFEDDKLYTIAFSRADGSEAWRAEAPAKEIEPYYKEAGSPAASTCATDGERIVSYFGSCGLFCYDLAGKELWRYEMPVATVAGNFGSGVSPILSDGKVILVRDEMSDAKIIALDAESGDLLWEKPRKSAASYCSPVVWDTPQGKQVAAAGHGRMVGYDIKSGTEKWFVVGLPSGCCPSPVTAEGKLFFAGWSPGGPDDKEFQMPPFDGLLAHMDKDENGSLSREEVENTEMASFFDVQDENNDNKITRDEWDAMLKFMAEGKNIAFALKPGGTGDVTKSEMIWEANKGLPYIPSAIVYREQYVMIKDGGIVTAYDAESGDQLYMKRAAASGTYYASPVAANGNIYITSLDEGIVTVLKAGTESPEVVVENPALGEKVSATPAIADDTLYIRTAEHLYAFAEDE